MRDKFYNSTILTKLILRRERVTSTLWILISAGFVALIAAGMAGAMDEASRLEMAAVMENPAMVAMVGPLIGTSFGAFFTTMMLVFTALAIVVMNIMFVVRHTRADEEKGRYEVVRSLPTGRLANLNAAIVAVVLINLVLAVATGLLLFAFGDYSMCFNGSMLWGALLGSVGLVFAAITAVFSQLSSGSRGAMGYSFMTMGVFYMMRAVGDAGAAAGNSGTAVLSLISPLGLIIHAEAFQSNHWWPIFVLIAIAIPIAAIAYRLNLTRDIDQGFFPDKQGKATGGKLLRTHFGLSVKLLKTSLIVGTITIFLIGASYGAIMGDIEGFIETNEFYQQLILWMDGISMPLLFAGMINFVASMMALIPMLLYVLKVRGEEKDVRAELVLATPVCRYKYLGGYIIIAFVSSVVLQFLTAFGLWISATAVLPDPSEFPLSSVLMGNLVYLPALWVMISLAILLIGIAPKATGFIWGAYGFVFLMGMFGRMDIFPAWTQNISPFGFIPQYPMESIVMLPLVVLTVIAAALTTVGLIGFRQRDIG